MTMRIARKHLGNLTVAEPPAADPGEVISLLHFDGADLSTTFTDEVGRTWSRATNKLKLYTAAKKFGTASLGSGAGGNDHLLTDSADFALGFGASAADFELDLWFYLTSADGGGWGNTLCSWRTDVAIGPALVIGGSSTGNTGKIHFFGTSDSVLSATAPTLNTWHHLLLNRYNGTVRMFLDGVLDATGTVTSTSSPTSVPFALAGGYYVNSYYRGYIDEFRFVRDPAERTANFTPPVAAYTYP